MLMWEILLPIFGSLIGIAASLTGVGGGVFIVPLLTILYGVDPRIAIGTSLTTIIFTAIASTLNYAKQRRIYYKTGIVLALTTAPGAFLGARIVKMISPDLLGFIFGFFLVIVAMRMIDFKSLLLRGKSTYEKTSQRETKSDDELVRSGKSMALAAGLSFFGGLASGLLGIGGGILVVPILAFAMDMPIHLATATSMFTMIFTSISGVTEHYLAENIDFGYALLIALGTIFGAQVGAFASKKVSGQNLRRIFALMLLVAGIKMIDQYKSVLGF